MTLRTDLSIVTLDWETYYSDEYQLKKLTTSQYVRDPRFQTVGVGVRTPGSCPDCGPANMQQDLWGWACPGCGDLGSGPVLTWYENAEFREWVKTVDWSKTATLAHHAQFDNLILTHHYGVVPAFIYDTLSCARALHGTDVGGSLAELSLHYGVGEKGHEVLNAKNKRREDFTPEDWATYGEYCKNDVALTWALFQKMAPKFPADELELIDQTVRMFSEPQLVLDGPRLAKFLEFEQGRKRDLLRRLLLTNMNPPQCDACFTHYDERRDTVVAEPCASCEAETERYIRSQLQSSDKLAALFRALDVEPPTKPSPKPPADDPDKRLFAFAKSDPGMQELLDHPRDEVRFLAEARIAVKSTINETRTGRLLAMADQGPVPVYLKYHGAKTGRDAGGDKLNFQNFQRGGEIRRCIKAPPGHVVLEVDSANIEPRVLSWSSGYTDMVEIYRSGRDVYNEFGSRIFGRKIQRKENPEDATEGHIAKSMVIGLGYGMGWAKFSLELLKGMLGSPPIRFDRAAANMFGVTLGDFTSNPRNVKRVREMQSRLPYEDLLLHCSVAHFLVNKYRTESKPIVDFWARLADTLPLMASLPPGEERKVEGIPALRFAHQAIILPNGMRLKYPGLREEYGDGWLYHESKRKPHVRLYGGVLVENITQALARVVVFSQVLQVQRETGYRPVTRTHDAGTWVVAEKDAPGVLAVAKAAFKTAPAWAPGLPLGVDGGFGPSMGEAK